MSRLRRWAMKEEDDMRGLSPQFLADLKTGFLAPLLNRVKQDKTICLEIRADYINIYYRGGNLLKVTRQKGGYRASFDRKYAKGSSAYPTGLPKALANTADIQAWLDAMPQLKLAMDLWFGMNDKSEREFQQVIATVNNFGKQANDTDYYICDIEYASHGRADMLALKWPSISTDKKNPRNVELALIEVKQGDKALTGKSGLVAHAVTADQLVSTSAKREKLSDEMMKLFNQKCKLGLIRAPRLISAITQAKPEYILILIDHNPASKVLMRELTELDALNLQHIDIKIAVSNYMGFGLYQYNLKSLRDLISALASGVNEPRG